MINCNASWTSEPPPVSWPYVRTMHIAGSSSRSLGFACGQSDLRDILPRLTALNKIRFENYYSGVKWSDVRIVSTAPNVRVLEIVEPWSLQRVKISSDGISSISTPLTIREIIYTVDCPRISEWSSNWRPDPVARQCYISPLILSLHETLEVLHIPIAMAPLTEMETKGWPHLRELKLYGESYDNGEDPTVFARLCAKIPRLRVLDFCFLHRGRTAQTLICPSNLPFSVSFEHLESVDICYPDPSDTLYSHLPSHLRHLHLVDRPRYYYFQEGDPRVRDNYTSQTLGTATDILAILKKLRSTPFLSLESLGIAFQADVQESALLAYITAIFPNLHFLQIHRYRCEGETTADMESVVV
ncbi:hypothetical protein DENSPDRAFT_845550 [Dentipellis sp. KUC8613]|nr:hypothetical protein DENSPDRAFT_845550 [Dentipellis sp. KUC8613]